MVFEPFDGLIKVTFQQSHFPFTVNLKLSLSFLNGFLMGNCTVAFQDVFPQSEYLVIKGGNPISHRHGILLQSLELGIVKKLGGE